MKRLFIVGLVLLGVTVGCWVSEANAAIIKIRNKGADTRNGSMYFETGAGFNEAIDGGDLPWSAFNGNSLEVNSNSEAAAPFDKLDYDCRPLNTFGIDAKLAVVGSNVTSDNQLSIKILDDTNLEYRKVIAYNLADPNTVYAINKQVDVTTTIDLDNLVNQPEGTYATWRVATPPLVPGDITDSTGVLGALDGVNNIYDLTAHAGMWLDTTSSGDNYSWGDLNYNRKNDLEDYSVIAGSWLE